jgi:zinc-finger of acetyl-transferase ESCO
MTLPTFHQGVPGPSSTANGHSAKRPRQQRRQSSPSDDAPNSLLSSSSSVMEVDEIRRQTSIQDYFFVKKSKKKAATATRAAGEDDRPGSARGAPLRSLSSNLSEISRQENAIQNGLPKVVGENARSDHRADDANVPCCRSKASTKRQYQQLFLDFGQRDFAEQQFCALCGMMVVHGVEEDIRQHEKICSEYKLGVPFHSDAARAVAHPRPGSAIYQVRTHAILPR